MSFNAQAQDATDSANLIYQVQPGDTLSELVQRYTEGEGVLAQIVQLNRLHNSNKIAPPQRIQIPRHFLRYTPSLATVVRLNCAKVNQMDGDEVKLIQNGSVIGEGDVLHVPAGCQFALSLEDQSTVRLMSGALIRIKTLRRNVLELSPEIKIELLDGRIDIRVPRLRGKGGAPFQIWTPSSVAGVRGTEFRVSFDAQSRLSQVAVTQGEVGARGVEEQNEKRLFPGQTLVVNPQGQSQATLPWMPPPAYAGVRQQPGTTEWWVQLAPVSGAESVLLKTSDDVLFSALSRDTQLRNGQFKIDHLQRTAVFYQWAAVTAQGWVGQEASVAICLAYRRHGLWRCNVPFDLPPLVRPRLRLEKLASSGQAVTVFDAEILSVEDHRMVFQALPAGVYRWQLEHDLANANTNANPNTPAAKSDNLLTTVLSGQFELVAIPGQDG